MVFNIFRLWIGAFLKKLPMWGVSFHEKRENIILTKAMKPVFYMCIKKTNSDLWWCVITFLGHFNPWAFQSRRRIAGKETGADFQKFSSCQEWSVCSLKWGSWMRYNFTALFKIPPPFLFLTCRPFNPPLLEEEEEGSASWYGREGKLWATALR